jgi:hypothetical protein
MLDRILPPRRGHRILIGFLVLAMILLPLYLWPPRLSFGGLGGVATLTGTVGDQRDPSALARIPGGIWAALMGEADAPAAPSTVSPARNLTMIADVQGGTVDAPPDSEVIAADTLVAQLGESVGNDSGATMTPGSVGELSSSARSQRLAGYSGGSSSGAGSAWAPFGGGSSAPGPRAGGGNPQRFSTAPTAAAGGAPPAPPSGSGPDVPPPGSGQGGGSLGPPTLSPPLAVDGAAVVPPSYPLPGPGQGGAFSPPTPTPEPATLLLVGSNAALLGAAAWKRCRRRWRTTPIG